MSPPQSLLLCNVHPLSSPLRFYLSPLRQFRPSISVSWRQKPRVMLCPRSFAPSSLVRRGDGRAGRLSNVFPIPFLQFFPLVSRGQVSVSFRRHRRLLQDEGVNLLWIHHENVTSSFFVLNEGASIRITIHTREKYDANFLDDPVCFPHLSPSPPPLPKFGELAIFLEAEAAAD